MGGFQTQGANAFGWAELNTRGIDQAIAFYEGVFGWTHDAMPATATSPEYTTFYSDGDRVGGAMPMDAAMPAEHPELLDALLRRRRRRRGVREGEGARRPGDGAAHGLPGGRFAIVGDPQGAMFGLMRFAPQP